MESNEKRHPPTEKKEVEIFTDEDRQKLTGHAERWFVPLMDFDENEENFYYHVEMPGVGENDVEMETMGNVIRVTGHTPHENDAEEQIIYSEYETGHYFRQFPVMDGVNRKEIAADIRNGVLTITLPKLEEYKPRRIPVKAG